MPRRCAYADPPYMGQVKKHYSDEAAADGRTAREVNHRLLIAYLSDEFPDGWALSCSSPSLQRILALCPPDVRIMAWVKPVTRFKVNVNPAYAWEPVIVRCSFRRPRTDMTIRDYISAGITMKRGTAGAKPEVFCRWVFDVLGLTPEDELVDLFPGSGAVGQAWDRFVSHRRLG